MRRAAALAASLAIVGCTATRPPVASVSTAGRQTLYRVRYQGDAGDGSFRLLLRRASDERFDLAASDPLGRTLWALEVAAGEGTWFDYRERRICVIGRQVQLEALRLPELPLAAIPRILSGAAPHAEGEDSSGRRWTLHHGGGGEITGWEVAAAGRTLLRGEVAADGRGTLIGEASSLEFRRVADEPMPAPLAPRQAPAGFERGGCSNLALS